jgi:predicted acetyltransferase
MAEFRPLDSDDYPEYKRFLRYAFAAEMGPLEGEQDGEGVDLFAERGVYDDGLKSVCKRYDIEVFVRDSIETIGGLGAVATPPEYRRKGYVRELCRGICREYRDDGIGLVVLWPFSTPFYRNLGWATANDFYDYECPPSALPSHDPRGAFRRLDADGWERLREVEAAFGEGVTLSMRRSETWWRERTLTNWTGGTEPYIYGYERDGDLAGYLVYTVDDEDDDSERTLSVSAYGYVDEDSERALLEFFRRHGAQIDNVSLLHSTESDLLDLAEDPQELTCERIAGPMVRLTGLDYLETLDWSPLGEAMTLSVEDPLLPENDGVFRVSPEGRIQEVGDATPSTVDVETDIGTLAQLFVGRYDPASAEHVGTLRLGEESLREPLTAVFPERAVCLREFF